MNLNWLILAVLFAAALGGVFWAATRPPEYQPPVPGNIIVSEPRAGARISRPLIVRGEARTFESTVNLRLKDASGTELLETFTTAASAEIGQYGPFTAEFDYPVPSTATGVLEVFQYSAADGTEIDRVTIPVVFQ